jgi:hypothetical protein
MLSRCYLLSMGHRLSAQLRGGGSDYLTQSDFYAEPSMMELWETKCESVVESMAIRFDVRKRVLR